MLDRGLFPIVHRAYRMIIAPHMGAKPLPLGGLGQHWAIHEAGSIAFQEQIRIGTVRIASLGPPALLR